MIEDKKYHPLLRCRACGIDTRHKYIGTLRGKVMDYDGCWDPNERPVVMKEKTHPKRSVKMKKHIFRCLVCTTERQWGSE